MCTKIIGLWLTIRYNSIFLLILKSVPYFLLYLNRKLSPYTLLYTCFANLSFCMRILPFLNQTNRRDIEKRQQLKRKESSKVNRASTWFVNIGCSCSVYEGVGDNTLNLTHGDIYLLLYCRLFGVGLRAFGAYTDAIT